MRVIGKLWKSSSAMPSPGAIPFPKGKSFSVRLPSRTLPSIISFPSRLANILPPPDDFTLPIVKLLTHPTYRDYQSRTAALSLYSNIFIKFIPPIWGAATPPTPAPYQLTTPSTGGITVNSVSSSEPETPITPITHESIEKKEWKRRIKMYSMYSSVHFIPLPPLTLHFASWSLP